ncbi:MAG: Uma2 family endonuclease [Chloroflexi bacterium]|nr:Uma2 family endonuclease [Chloroflexota bacterium]
MEWSRVINHPLLQNLPFKIEQNKFGQLLMSPATNRHGMLQVAVAVALSKKKKNGRVINGCSIQTSDGVKVADVCWASDAFIAEHGDTTPYARAPELCVEIISPSNSRAAINFKIELYLARGAQKVWTVDERGNLKIFTHTGAIKSSRLAPRFKINFK